MTCPLGEIDASERVFRLGHTPDPWQWPEWEWVEPTDPLEPTSSAAGRWDDPEREFRVLYVASDRRTTFFETLAHFEADPEIETEWALVEGDEDSLAPGELPAEWITRRCVGTALLEGRFALAAHSDSLVWFRRRLADFARSYGIDYLDAGAIQLSAPRPVTQAISRLVYECGTQRGPQYAGLVYPSRHGNELRCWAVFEQRAALHDLSSEPVGDDDPDFRAAVEHFSLRIVGP